MSFKSLNEIKRMYVEDQIGTMGNIFDFMKEEAIREIRELDKLKTKTSDDLIYEVITGKEIKRDPEIIEAVKNYIKIKFNIEDNEIPKRFLGIDFIVKKNE